MHTWDLARATGGSEALEPELLRVMWDVMEPMLPGLAAPPTMGGGASGDVGPSAPLLLRVLDGCGRRPGTLRI